MTDAFIHRSNATNRRVRSRLFRAACTTLIAAVLAGCERRPEQEKQPSGPRPNIILITVESIRADHVGCYGYERATTPAFDALSAQAVTFDNAYSVTSWTLTSHASMFTGLYPTAHKVVGPKDRLHDSYKTMAEVLHGVGYQTAGIISGPFLRGKHNLHQGFEIYDESAAHTSHTASHGDVTNERMEALITSFLTRQRDGSRPFFLFLYFWDPHYDYIPPAPYGDMFVPPHAETIDVRGYETKKIVTKDISQSQLDYVVAQYDGEIRCTDELLGRLWQRLRELGLWDNTAIVLTADHGEEFFEHGKKGHKNSLHVESLHVPLIIKPARPVVSDAPPPTSAPAVVARRDAGVANSVDLYPTILALAGIQADQPHHGRDLLGASPDQPRPSFYELVTSWYFKNRSTGKSRKESEQWMAVRLGDYKLITVRNKNHWTLYNVIQDPRELHALGSDHQGKMTELRLMLGRHERRMQALAARFGVGGEAKLTPEELQRLWSLGYINRSPADDSER